jgi:hypothetical protein
MYLSLDVSTTSTGVAGFDAQGELIGLSAYSPVVSKKVPDSDHLLVKAQGLRTHLLDHYDLSELRQVWIEEPIQKGPNQFTVILLARFNAVVTYFCWHLAGRLPEHVSVHAWRSRLCPEFQKTKVLKSGKMGKSTWQLPEELDPKTYIHQKVLAWFPQLMAAGAVHKKDGTLRSQTFDKSDAVGVGVAKLLELGVLNWVELERRLNVSRRVKRGA